MQTERMYVQLKLVLDTDPAAAWRALRSPTVMRELYAPLIDVALPGAHAQPSAALQRTDPPIPASQSDGAGQATGSAVPATRWQRTREQAVLSLAGVVPLGRQLIDLEYDETRHNGVNILRDTGTPSTGPLSILRGWNHRMAISHAPEDAGRTLLRDRLSFRGPAAAASWYPLWAIWQWRGARLRTLAPTWAFDPELHGDAAD